MRLTTVYKINDKLQIVEYTNTARKNESEPKFEYYVRIQIQADNFIREEYSVGCDCRLNYQSIKSLLGQGYFNHEINAILRQYLEV